MSLRKPECSQQVDFADCAWLAYIPIRMSDTISIQEHLPTGAAAVLLNQIDTYKDLFLPISPLEKQWFDAIDGLRCIGDIVERRPAPANRTGSIEVARGFFERLWWYDQVVFDTSQQANA